ncbi:hypothetical protein NUW58_g8195 [Xylaria curta]|uniref:Uncharacterized protein n=1 Tax=Xylaria curta TaxID=42375 RepID=A0ACC1N9R3_9PEZI|nr:hypothetical protein NUW58_g8195 [Xylaria curta]
MAQAASSIPPEDSPSDELPQNTPPRCCWDGLAASLHAVRRHERFSSMKKYSLAPNPVLQVDNAVIALPLTDHGVELIKQACGYEDSPDLNTDVGHVWRLSTDQFRLLNPVWTSFLGTMLDDVRKGLSMTSPVDAQLCELLLYGQGASYRLRNYAAEGGGVAAMVAVYLPSAHEGGRVRVSYANESCIIHTDDSSMFSTVSISWASDVTYEMNGITSGHSLLLTYYIVDRSTIRHSSTINSQQFQNAAIICPKIQLGFYLYPLRNANLRNITDMVMKDLDDWPAGREFPRELVRIFEEILHPRHISNLPPGVRKSAVQWAWEKQHQILYVRIISSRVTSCIDDETMNAVAELINEDIREDADTRSTQWGRFFDGAIGHHGQLKYLQSNLQTVENHLRDTLKLSFRAWKWTAEQYMFRNIPSLCYTDIQFFLDSVAPAKDCSDWVVNCLIPALRVQNDVSLIRLSIRHLLSQSGHENNIEIANKIVLYTCQEAAMGTTEFDYNLRSNHEFRLLIERCLKVGLNDSVIRLLDATWANIAPCHADPGARPLNAEKAGIGSFLKRLGFLLEAHNFPHIYSTREIFRLLIRRYLYVEVPSYPQKLPGWSHKPRGCGCAICAELDTFLQAEDVVTNDFPEENTLHLLSRIRGTLLDRVLIPTPDGERLFRINKVERKEYQQELRSYRKQVSEFESHIKELRGDYLEGLLGEADYRELVMLEQVKGSEGAKQLAKSAAGTGVKRSAREASVSSEPPVKKIIFK